MGVSCRPVSRPTVQVNAVKVVGYLDSFICVLLETNVLRGTQHKALKFSSKTLTEHFSENGFTKFLPQFHAQLVELRDVVAN